jgi:hypothetical protein
LNFLAGRLQELSRCSSVHALHVGWLDPDHEMPNPASLNVSNDKQHLISFERVGRLSDRFR